MIFNARVAFNVHSRFCNRLKALPTGWPDSANFRLLGDCLLWMCFLKFTKVAQIFGLLFSHDTSCLCINFAKKMFRTHFGRFFSQTRLFTLVPDTRLRQLLSLVPLYNQGIQTAPAFVLFSSSASISVINFFVSMSYFQAAALRSRQLLTNNLVPCATGF
jgi:hypothetical protein